MDLSSQSPQVRSFRWKSVVIIIVIALIAIALAFLFDYLNRDEIVTPAERAERINELTSPSKVSAPTTVEAQTSVRSEILAPHSADSGDRAKRTELIKDLAAPQD